MTCRTSTLPFLPGGFQKPNLNKNHFGKKIVFDHAGDLCILVNKITPYLPGKTHERYPSIYTRDVSELPGWLAFDRQVLTFDAYFQETLHDSSISPIMLHVCKIYFYLEDGTIKINEPKIKNSAGLHGNILARNRVTLPPPKNEFFYDIIDLNVGKEIEIYGRNYKIINCDKFTRTFLNRLGIAVPSPITVPEDSCVKLREKQSEKYPKKPKTTKNKLLQMYENDRKVLRFYGFWDDRTSQGGYIHDLTIHYHLMDDTIEVVETHDNTKTLLTKRGKVFKNMPNLPEPGFFEDQTLLNVLNNGRSKPDVLHPGRIILEYYKSTDLAIGSAINLYGRKIVLTDCDKYTKDYYNKFYGIDNFIPMERPKEPSPVVTVRLRERKLPPWNGYGSFIDSAQNCLTVEPKAQLRDVKQFLKLDRYGLESHILRYKAANRDKLPSMCKRKFIISFYLCDDTIAIHEVQGENAGPRFMKRTKIKLPGQEVYVSEEYDYYKAEDLFVGATLNINGFIFIIIDADEYALRYTEINCDKFPKSNIRLIMDKVRKAIKPIYNEFMGELNLKESFIEFDVLREKLINLLGDNFTEHEMITLARFYTAVCREPRHSRDFIRNLVLVDLRRNLWQQIERFKECFNHYDIMRRGSLPRNEVYNLIKGCRLPLDNLLINAMLDILKKNEKCEIEAQELFDFIDETVGHHETKAPINQMHELAWSTESEITAGKVIDWCKLAADIKNDTISSENKYSRQG